MWSKKRDKETRFSDSKGDNLMNAFEEKDATNEQFGLNEKGVINIGKSVFIKGELTGDEDLTIEGRVEGKIDLREHNLVIGPNGKITAEVFAKSITVMGSIVGNVSTSGLLEIKASGSVVGDLSSPRISVADGAYFKGNIDMKNSTQTAKKTESPKTELNFSQQSVSLPKNFKDTTL